MFTSSFIKLLKKLSRRNKTKIDLNPEVEITLSMIESGCIAVKINNNTAFIYKESQETIESLKEIQNISIEFECIKRPEFPTVAIHFNLSNKNKSSYQFEYFFGIDSEEEMKLLEILGDQDYFEIHFADYRIEFTKGVEITKNDKDKIRSMIYEAYR